MTYNTLMELRQNLINYYKDNANCSKINFFLMGGGYHLCSMLTEPGLSGIVNSIIVPYDQDFASKLLELETKDIKCNEKSQRLITNIINNKYPNNINIVVNAALTTYRYRKGDNRCYISINDKNYFIKFTKLHESCHTKPTFNDLDLKRSGEDYIISVNTLSLFLSNDFILRADTENAYNII